MPIGLHVKRSLFYPILTKFGMYGQIIVKLPDVYENTFNGSRIIFFFFLPTDLRAELTV
jgi:hypothetical protein